MDKGGGGRQRKREGQRGNTAALRTKWLQEEREKEKERGEEREGSKAEDDGSQVVL